MSHHLFLSFSHPQWCHAVQHPPRQNLYLERKSNILYFKITHFSPKQHIPILSLYLISGQILNRKESDYNTKVQMTHQTLTSLKDKWKCCSLKSSTANHSGNREHKVHRPRQAWGRGAAPRTGDGVELQKAYLGVVFWVFVCLPWRRFYLSLTLKLQKYISISQLLGSYNQSFLKTVHDFYRFFSFSHF